VTSTDVAHPARGTEPLNRRIDAALQQVGCAVEAWHNRSPIEQAGLEWAVHPSYAMADLDSELLVHCLTTAAQIAGRREDAGGAPRGWSWWEMTADAIRDELIARLAALDPDNPF
jgi:hypothetical protein